MRRLRELGNISEESSQKYGELLNQIEDHLREKIKNVLRNTGQKDITIYVVQTAFEHLMADFRSSSPPQVYIIKATFPAEAEAIQKWLIDSLKNVGAHLLEKIDCDNVWYLKVKTAWLPEDLCKKLIGIYGGSFPDGFLIFPT